MLDRLLGHPMRLLDRPKGRETMVSEKVERTSECPGPALPAFAVDDDGLAWLRVLLIRQSRLTVLRQRRREEGVQGVGDEKQERQRRRFVIFINWLQHIFLRITRERKEPGVGKLASRPP